MQLKTMYRHQGAGLIEVLIAVLVLAVGLLGFAGLQTQAIKMNYETLQRAKASALAEDILDRMRSNVGESLDQATYVRNFGDEAPIAAKDCAVGACTPAELARWDLANWLTRLSAEAPGADAAIIRPEVLRPNYYRISIRLVETSELITLSEEELADDEVVTVESNITFDYFAVL